MQDKKVGAVNTEIRDHETILEPLVSEIEGDNDFRFFGWKSFDFWQFMKFAGPGWLMSIAYLDPGNITADLNQGANTNYALLWVLLFATCSGLFFQILAARLGTVTGQHLAEVCKDEYPRPVSLLLWIMTEIAIIGSDIQEVGGSAVALNVLFGIPLIYGVLITGFDSFIFLLLERLGVRKLESFFIALVALMAMSFGYVFFVSEVNYGAMATGIFVPTLSSDSKTISVAVGMLGAVVMPHNIYLHSALVTSRDVNRKSTGRVMEANFYFGVESTLALFLSFIINLFVVCVFAARFFQPGVVQDFNLQNAADALTKSIGPGARILWGLGLLASGQSSTMTGTYAGQFVMEGFLEWKVSKFQRTLITRCIALVPAVCVAYYTQGQPGGLTSLEDDLNLLQSIQLPFAVLPVVRFTSSAAVMGQFANGRIISIFGSISTVVVLAVNGYAIYGFVEDLDFTPTTTALVVMATLFYVTLIGFVFFSKVGKLHSRKPSASAEGTSDADYNALTSEKSSAIMP